MRKSLSIAAMTLLLTSIFPSIASAQDFRWSVNPGFGRMHRSGYGFRRDFRQDAGRSARIAQEVARLRDRISRELADGDISEMRANRLNARLDNIEARARAMAYGGLTMSEFAMLQARLNDVRVAASGSMYY